MTTKTKRVTTQERGWAGHFICGPRCYFHRNTLVTCGQTRIVVSTVGNCHSSLPGEDGPREIGCNRYYETMAFVAHKDGCYWEMNVAKELSFNSPWAIDECKEDSDGKADEMHDAVVAEFVDKMSSGWKP
jgi:hypothetical protein